MMEKPFISPFSLRRHEWEIYRTDPIDEQTLDELHPSSSSI